MYKFTLIIPTHNRHNYLIRSMSYFKNLTAEVIYCDSSENAYTGTIARNINYLHLPNQYFSQKIIHALAKVRTEYVALCADDDFILIESLYSGANYLESNTAYSTVTGKYVGFNEIFDGNFYKIYNEPLSEITGNYTCRAKLFFNNYSQILWALYRKETLDKAFEIIDSSKLKNDNFIELIIGAVCCYNGNIKFLDQIWGIREITNNNHWGTRHVPIPNMKPHEIENDFIKIRALLDSCTNIGYSDLVLKSYLEPYLKSGKNIVSIGKKLIPKMIKNKIKIFLNTIYKQDKKIIINGNDLNKIVEIEDILLNRH